MMVECLSLKRNNKVVLIVVKVTQHETANSVVAALADAIAARLS